MAFCINCGHGLAVEAKFCSECGTPVSNSDNQRKTVYDGEIHKCPNCGEILESFATFCATCGYELRGTKNSGSVREFAAKLEEIEHSRPPRKFSKNSIREAHSIISETDERKISLIRSFAIPNTKEDLFEFLVLAASNIDVQRYDDSHVISAAEKATSDAWKAKLDQAYEKAKLSFGNTPEFKKIHSIYEKKNADIKKNKKKNAYYCMGLIGFFVAIVIVVAIGLASDQKKIEAENARLDAIVEQVYSYIEDGNYSLARAKAATLVFSGSTTQSGNQAAEKWDITREELFRIIDNAVNIDNNDKAKPNDLDESSKTNNSNAESSTFDEASVIKKLKVKEYHLKEDGYTFLVIENNSDYNLFLTANVKFYNKDNQLVGAETNRIHAVEKGTSTILRFFPDEDYSRIEYELSASEEDTYDCIISSLTYTSVSAKDKEIISITNNGDISGNGIEGHALFFKDGKLVEYSSAFFVDKDFLIKPGKTITKELNCNEKYDDFKFFITGEGEW